MRLVIEMKCVISNLFNILIKLEFLRWSNGFQVGSEVVISLLGSAHEFFESGERRNIFSVIQINLNISPELSFCDTNTKKKGNLCLQ